MISHSILFNKLDISYNVLYPYLLTYKFTLNQAIIHLLHTGVVLRLLSPIVFVAMFCLIYLASKDVLHLDQYAMINYPVIPNRGAFGKSPPMPQPELSIKALDNHGWKIALYPRNDPVMKAFAEWADDFMPGFNSTDAVGTTLEKLDVPKFSDVVKWFDSEEDLDDYIRDTDYSSNPLIVSALKIESDENSKWTVTIRANGTTIPTTYLDVMVTTRAYPTTRIRLCGNVLHFFHNSSTRSRTDVRCKI